MASNSSGLPDGGYNPQLGSNYMMDGFEFDSDYGEGVDTARKDPDPDLPRSNSGLAALPDGFMGAEEAVGGDLDFRMLQATDEDASNLSAFVAQTVREAGWAQRSGLQDFDWLEGAEQDPARLPQSVNLYHHDRNSLGQTVVSDVDGAGTRDELSLAWGTEERTNGQTFVPNREYPKPEIPATSSLPGDQLREIVAHAMRRSAFGEDLGTILSEMKGYLGPQLFANGFASTKQGRALHASIQALRSEHGLVGNVYVRESAFPKILSGKWDSAIRRRCASARYLLVSPNSKIASKGDLLGMKVVTEIPWREAAEHYRPILATQGKRLASGDPKRALAAAFRSDPERKVREANFPIHNPPSVSSETARKAFSSAQEVLPQAPKSKTATEKARLKADMRIERWVRAGLLSPEKAREMQVRISDPWALYREASKFVASAEVKQYEGTSFITHQPAKKTASTGNALEVRRLLRWASVQMTEGAVGRDLDTLLSARFSGELLKQASEPLVQLRKKHEGLSGHLYVNASAYASPEGTTGCDRGALVHRANAIKAVLGMDRCVDCTANVGGSCQKYAKTLVDSVPTKNPEGYQKETIRLANSDDAERTASLFAPAFDAQEFALRNNVLDDIEYDHAPPTEDLGEVLFGGMVLDEE